MCDAEISYIRSSVQTGVYNAWWPCTDEYAATILGHADKQKRALAVYLSSEGYLMLMSMSLMPRPFAKKALNTPLCESMPALSALSSYAFVDSLYTLTGINTKDQLGVSIGSSAASVAVSWINQYSGGANDFPNRCMVVRGLLMALYDGAKEYQDGTSAYKEGPVDFFDTPAMRFAWEENFLDQILRLVVTDDIANQEAPHIEDMIRIACRQLRNIHNILSKKGSDTREEKGGEQVSGASKPITHRLTCGHLHAYAPKSRGYPKYKQNTDPTSHEYFKNGQYCHEYGSYDSSSRRSHREPYESNEQLQRRKRKIVMRNAL
jgi:hypothetical protein